MSTSTRYVVIALAFGGVVAFLTPYILQPEGWPLPAAAFAAVVVYLGGRRARGAHRPFAAPRPRVGAARGRHRVARPRILARESVSPRPARHGLTSVAVAGSRGPLDLVGCYAYA